MMFYFPAKKLSIPGRQILIALILIGLCAIPIPSSFKSTPITGAEIGSPIRYYETYGDIWANTWADNGVVYVMSDDSKGWNESNSSNVCIMTFTGTKPTGLSGGLVNALNTESSNFGVLAEIDPADNSTWKGNGLTCVDGILYLTVSRHTYGWNFADKRQRAFNASIIKSSDYGKTWTPSSKHCFQEPMFPGPTFAVPMFVEYIKNYKIPDGKGGWKMPPHGADSNVYAVSNEGFWCNGSRLILGRVKRSKIGRLKASDWEFYRGDGADGMLSENWSNDVKKATPILSAPSRLGQVGIQFIPGLNRYVMIEWFYPSLIDPKGPEGMNTGTCSWHFYEAPTPWGPWKKFFEKTFEYEGYYNPFILAKSISPDGLTMTLLTAGDFWTWSFPEETRLYRLYAMELRLGTEFNPIPRPSSIINDDDQRIAYKGKSWSAETGRLYGDYRKDIHSATAQGDSFELEFTGNGIDFITEINQDLGRVDINIDGALQTTVDCHGPVRQTQQIMYRNRDLKFGTHTIRGIKRSGERLIVDAFQIYEPDKIPSPEKIPFRRLDQESSRGRLRH